MRITGVFVIFGFLALSGAAAFQLQSPEPAGQQPEFRVTAETVKVPVVVVDEDGKLYTELKREHFSILEDGEPQEISAFLSGESPLTIVLLLEYSRVIQYLRSEVLRPAGIFVSQIMGPEDYAAVIAFDIRPEILTDFTRNRQKLMNAIQTLIYSSPAFSESNLFDAVQFVVAGGTVDNVEYKGLDEVEGRTGVLLVATGLDTFSGINFGDAREAVANAGVPVFSIGVGELAFIRAEPYLSGLQRITFLQAQNQLRTLSEESGGRFYSVRFAGAVDDVLDSIAKMLRFQYTLGYIPINQRQEGKRRKIEVLVDIDGDGREDNDRLDLQHRRYYYEPGD